MIKVAARVEAVLTPTVRPLVPSVRILSWVPVLVLATLPAGDRITGGPLPHPDHVPPAVSRPWISPAPFEPGDELGYAIAGIGDFDADGYDDWAAAAPVSDVGGIDVGAAYVFRGGPARDAVPILTLRGEAPGDKFGESLAGIGDFNADGWSDLVVGADGNDAFGFNSGRVYLYFGGPLADAIPDLVFSGEAPADFLGFSCAAAGDLDADGHPDLAISAPLFDAAGLNNAGRVYVYFGGAGADTIADLRFDGRAEDDQFGRGLAGVGDTDGDGEDDLCIGAPYHDVAGADAGAAWVYRGGAALDSIPDRILPGMIAGENLGWPLRGAGDVDGDDIGDIAVSAPAGVSGTVRVFGGPAHGIVPILTLSGTFDGERFGSGLDAADLNGDGWGDIVVGSARGDRIVVVYGGPGADTTADHRLTGIGGEGFGYAVACVGDLAGDGFPDLAVGSVNAAVPGQSAEIRVFDFNRYHVLEPTGDERFGDELEVLWLGGEPADILISRDGGVGWSTLASDVGGQLFNDVRLPYEGPPTSQAIVQVVPSGPVSGRAFSGTFTIGVTAAGGRIGASPSPASGGAPVRLSIALPSVAWGRERPDFELAVFDVRGRRLATLLRGGTMPGTGVVELTWNPPPRLAPAVVFVRARCPSLGLERTRRLVLMP